MPTVPHTRYQLDPTGVNPDNYIEGELHTLTNRQVRAIVPYYGPYFTESLVVIDNANNTILTKGTQYQVVELLQTAALKYGKEICVLILLTDPAVSNVVRINYQVLGGLYQNSSQSIAAMYESAMSDDRPVNWADVLNKPVEYPAGLHKHLLEDVYGFEPLVVAMERIRNALILSDVPALESIIAYVKNAIDNIATAGQIQNPGSGNNDPIGSMNPSTSMITYSDLLEAARKLNFNAIHISPSSAVIPEDTIVTFYVYTSNLPDYTRLYWTIKHQGTNNDDFMFNSGQIDIVNNRATFNITTKSTAIAEPDEGFVIEIRREGTFGPVIASTGGFTISGHGVLPPAPASYYAFQDPPGHIVTLNNGVVVHR